MTEEELRAAYGADRPPLTETELVLACLTNEELGDAIFFLHVMKGRWDEHVRYMERTGGVMTGYDRADGWAGTDGPLRAIEALDAAIVRELAIRNGAEPWHAHMSAEGHPRRGLIAWARERLELNGDLKSVPRLNAAGVLEQRCPSCGEAKPMTIAFWRWLGSSIDHFCRACRVAGEREGAERLREVLVDDQDARAAAEAAQEAVTAPEPFAAADVVDVEAEVAL